METTSREKGRSTADALVQMVHDGDRRGQEAFVTSNTLPVSIEPDGAEAVLEAAGVRFLEPMQGDPLFRHVELPAGWKKVPASNAWLTMLVDGQNRERARIFYKPASYDRKAALILVPRYGIYESCYRMDWIEEGSEQEFVVCVTDGGVVLDGRKTIHETEVIRLAGDKRARFRATRGLIKEAEAWLDQNYPDWRNSFAYWD